MKTDQVLRRACGLRNSSTGLPTTKVPAPVYTTHVFRSQRSSRLFERSQLEPLARRTFDRQYSTTRAWSSTTDISHKILATNFYGDDGFGRIRYDEIALGKDGRRIAKVTIQNSAAGNSLNVSLLQHMTTAFRELSQKDDLRCVILTGDKGFCTGMHVTELANLATPDQARSLILKVCEAGQAIRETAVPTIAQIEGRCYGAGLELAASCDFRYALKGTVFAMPEVALGVPSVVQARLLANIIGWQKTRQLLLVGNNVDTDIAPSWGLVDYVYPTAELLRFNVLKTAQSICDNAPLAMKSQKRLINYWEENDLAAGIAASVDAFAGAFEGGAVEPKEYTQRFFVRKQKAKKDYEARQAIKTADEKA
ncbi:hypothetical protein A1O7_02499 [Cladophialophora yegresii CBS 114405]|uniref:Enoyl-CoA hydratase n=1 Tax=Cladophialophora yegresii CBS 114405 TaxID=1182544 RepID=W9WBW8_9EURO|nr:uncharacterized protein A1O7_02499 [Cladophialophora yegresii CBS 114405]EXJ62066.1 hypothetical protein A1O7_02499 [Cladophialophora yegresii CBS 114405]